MCVSSSGSTGGLRIDFSAGTTVAGSEDQQDKKDRDPKPVHTPDFNNNLLSLCDGEGYGIS
jgi:hypothetical protein